MNLGLEPLPRGLGSGPPGFQGVGWVLGPFSCEGTPGAWLFPASLTRGLCLALFRWTTLTGAGQKENPIKPSERKGQLVGWFLGEEGSTGLKMRNTGQEGPTWRRSLPLRAPSRGKKDAEQAGVSSLPHPFLGKKVRRAGVRAVEPSPSSQPPLLPRDFLSFPWSAGQRTAPQPMLLSLTLLMGQLGPMQQHRLTA